MGNESDELTTKKEPVEPPFLHPCQKVPVIVTAYAPAGSMAKDRFEVGPVMTIGRGANCDIVVDHEAVSKQHLRISKLDDRFVITDLGSTNGTFVNGRRLSGTAPLRDRSVIRLGQVLLAFHLDGARLLIASANTFGIAGRFHTPGLIRELREAALSKRHVLLTGPSGTGKELSAHALAAMFRGKGNPVPVVIHNAAQFASEEEASTTLFGVAAGVFSDVRERTGLIESARGGVLFLDEAHNLPARVQKSLLRVIEEGMSKRIGESRSAPAKVQFIIASNIPDGTHGLAHDLFARLRRVTLPSLTERAGDIPSIFDAVLEAALTSHSIAGASYRSLLSADYYEALMLDGFPKENVRGLVDIADRIATKINAGVRPGDAVARVFAARFSESAVVERHGDLVSSNLYAAAEMPRSRYDRHKERIVSAFHKCNGNISAMERLLKSHGLQFSRRWLTHYVKKWGLRR